MEKDEIFKNRLAILGKLAASLIHEIRSPLSVIKMNLDYLLMNTSGLSDDSVESLDTIKESVNRMNFIVSNFLSFAKRSSCDDELICINDITNIAVRVAQIEARMNGIHIQSDLQPNIPLVKICKDKLLQVFLNLIYNSVEASSKEKVIYIRTFIKNENDIIWEIKDSGVGIDENSKGKIFTEFYTNKKEGTGIGLSICKSILDHYGFKLEFESELNVGTKFFITFPLKQKEK